MYPVQGSSHALDLEPDGDFDYVDDNENVEHHHFLDGHPALKFLLAGGIAGAGTLSFPTCLSFLSSSDLLVSRTSTAPFDRLKVFLITRPPELLGVTASSAQVKTTGIKVIVNAIARIYAEGGLLAFWVGNGLSVAKIFPESAIKFFTYESAVSSNSSMCILMNTLFYSW